MQLDKLSKTYEKIFLKSRVDLDAQTDKIEKNRKVLEYLVLRLTFINPIHLPSMTECYLRKDFHFGMYLAYCYGKVLKKFF